jgi:antitoxin (DNA-binding transcriptional repressor) of toxin-antitoxin stability system
VSRLIDLVYHGETITITKNNLPIVDMVPHRMGKKRQLGTLAGQITVPDDFDHEDPAIEAAFYGESS